MLPHYGFPVQGSPDLFTDVQLKYWYCTHCWFLYLDWGSRALQYSFLEIVHWYHIGRKVSLHTPHPNKCKSLSGLTQPECQQCQLLKRSSNQPTNMLTSQPTITNTHHLHTLPIWKIEECWCTTNLQEDTMEYINSLHSSL